MADNDVRREQLREVLEQAEVEIRSALARVDRMGSYELAELRGAAGGLVAFFDKNGTCAASEGRAAFDPVAFFDKNGTCSAAELRAFDQEAFFDKNGTCAAPLGSVGRRGY